MKKEEKEEEDWESVNTWTADGIRIHILWMNSWKCSVYKGLWQLKIKQKRKKEEEDGWITGNGSSNTYAYERIPAIPVFTRVQQQLKGMYK